MIRHGVPKECTVSGDQDVEEIIRVSALPESVDKHEQMVLLNPDDYNSWNYLKEHAGTDDRDVERQMYLTQQAIQSNPKSYAAWHHRYFFFRMHKKKWFFEHKLCALLLSLDKRNSHCWNYCLRNNFNMKLDLHNYTSMHFGSFRDSFLFIDPSDEGVWRSFEKRHQSSFGVLRVDATGAEVLFNRPFNGRMLVNGKETLIGAFTKRVHLGRVCVNDMSFDGRRASLCADNALDVVEHVLRLDPCCIHALKYKLRWSKDAETADRLKSLDPLRARYYDTLLHDTVTYSMVIE